MPQAGKEKPGRKPLDPLGRDLRRVTINLPPDECAALDGFVATHLVAYRERAGRTLTATHVIRTALRKALASGRGNQNALGLDDLAETDN